MWIVQTEIGRENMPAVDPGITCMRSKILQKAFESEHARAYCTATESQS